MKKKIILMLSLIAIMAVSFAISISAATYYCDKDGNLVEAGNENIAYEYELTNNKIPNVYLHDSSVTKIIIPNMSDYEGRVQLQSGFDSSLGIYMLSDKDTKTTSLITQIKEVVIGENIHLDGAYSAGAFAGYTALEKISFYQQVSVASKGGFFQNCNIKEVNFYGTNLTIPSKLITDLKSTNEVTIVFHKGSTGTLATGSETLPTSASLNNWKIIINENIKPSNSNDARLGTKWGATVSTTGWELIIAVDNVKNCAPEQLEILKTSHGFCSRAASVDTAVVKEATIYTYCELGYDAHNSSVQLTYDNGFENTGKKTYGCSKCNSGPTEETPALFTCLGYSAPEDGRGGIAIGYTVNNEAIEEYTEAIGKTLKYGVFAVLKDRLGNNDIFAEDGSVAEGVVNAEITNYEFVAFELKIVGFTDEHKDTKLAMGAYVAVTDGETTEYSYMQGGEPNENEKYCFVSYNDIVGKQSVNAEVIQ